MSKRIVLITIAAVAVLIVASVWLYTSTRDPVVIYPPGPQMNFTKSTPYWEDQIRKYGGVKALARLTIAMQNLTDGQKHGYGHIFGEALFKVKGLDGFDVCAYGEVQSGCYHQFFGSAFAELGLGSLSQFNERCTESRALKHRGCFHGVGHGIVAALGFTRADLDKELGVCDKYFTDVGWRGCIDGVYMGYMTRDVGEGGLENPEPPLALTEESRYGPCFSLAEKYRPICAFELPHWWYFLKGVVNNPTNEELAKEGMWCEVLSYNLYLDCMRGIGYTLLTSNTGDVAILVDYCETAADGQYEGKASCLFGAAKRHNIDYPDAPIFCADPSYSLKDEQEKKCEDYSFKDIIPTSYL